MSIEGCPVGKAGSAVFGVGGVAVWSERATTPYTARLRVPSFQETGRHVTGRLAFVGLDSQDVKANAQGFLRQFPVDYPSMFDPSARQAQSLGGGQGWPTTIYMNAKHQINYVHEGAYPSLRALRRTSATTPEVSQMGVRLG